MRKIITAGIGLLALTAATHSATAADLKAPVVKAPVEVCEKRDPKGLYAKARAGQVKEFTGVSAPYEEPREPELVLDTSLLAPDACAQRVIGLLESRGVTGRPARRPA